MFNIQPKDFKHYETKMAQSHSDKSNMKYQTTDKVVQNIMKYQYAFSGALYDCCLVRQFNQATIMIIQL